MTLLMALRRNLLCLAAALLSVSGASAPASTADNGAITRGAYLAIAADCGACHTDTKAGGAPLAGGPPLATPFGTFYGPNITPDKQTGIGNWTEDQFKRALRAGINEHGAYMFPVFPYTSFTNLTDADAADLYAYLMSVPPVVHRAPPNDVKFPFGWRPLLFGWRMLFFREGPLTPVAGESDEWNRGRYLAEAVVHCQECHTPRNFLGALDRRHSYAGNPHGPDGQDAPDITPDKKDGIGDWKLDDLIDLLKTGSTPDGDIVGKGMADVVDGTGKLTDADRHALAAYIQTLPALPKTPK
jgi:mono/diheme cytochrome c family protein